MLQDGITENFLFKKMNYLELKKIKIRASEALREKLKTHNNLSELARLSEVSRTTLWKIRKGNSIANCRTINKIEDALKRF